MLEIMASELLNNKNRVAKAVAAFIRNKIEDFHVKYLYDEQMRKINPLIRNAIFTFVCDHCKDYTSLAVSSNQKLCLDYILNNVIPFLRAQNIPMYGIKEFKQIISTEIGFPLIDLCRGGKMMVVYEWMYVPEYWEDCVYCDNLKTSV